MSNRTEISATDVVRLMVMFEVAQVLVWVDGGWGVDALLGRQTRPHADLDIVLEQQNLGVVRKLLEEMGFTPAERDDTRPWNFVLQHDDGRSVDFHVIVIDGEGNGIYGPPEQAQFYPADALTGRGEILRHAVHCISATYQVVSRSGYPLREVDVHDTKLLRKAFGLV